MFLAMKSCPCRQGVFTKRTILSDPDNIRKIFSVNWDDQPGNTDLQYRDRKHWQSITVSTHYALLALNLLLSCFGVWDTDHVMLCCM